MLPDISKLALLLFSPVLFGISSYFTPHPEVITPPERVSQAVLDAKTSVISPTPPPMVATKTPLKQISRRKNMLALSQSAAAKKHPKPTRGISITPTTTISTTPTPIKVSPTPTISPPSSSSISWQIRSVSSMKETKDAICNPRSDSFISQWVGKAAELGVNYVAIETPYENPSCGDALSYTRKWVSAARAKGLKVWHRHMPLAFEGIYNVTKTANLSTIPIIQNYIRNNRDLFQEGDIFTPIPEPQNGGISGVTYCSQGICEFNSKEDFNSWLRNAMTESNNAFGDIGLKDKMKIGYYGFDGFVAWGDNNPDWNGILEDSTISQMGNITIDHYPEQVGGTMSNDLDELQRRYPGVNIIIGEWGRVTTSDPVKNITDTMTAARRSGVIGFNYWHMGMGGNESLINDDFSNQPGFDTVKSFFTK